MRARQSESCSWGEPWQADSHRVRLQRHVSDLLVFRELPSNEKCNYGAQNFPLNTKQSKGSTDPFRTLTFGGFFSSVVPKRIKTTCLGLQSRKRIILTATKQSPVLLCPWETNMKPPNVCTYTSAAISSCFHFTATAQIWLHRWLWNSKFIFGLCHFPCKKERIVNMWWEKQRKSI